MDTRVKRSEFFSFFLRFFPPSSSSSSSFRLGSVLEMGVRVYEGVYTRRFEIFFGAKGASDTFLVGIEILFRICLWR